MGYKILVMAHILGAALWIGGRAVLVGVVIPRAKRTGDIERLQEFEKGIGRIGLAALVVQLVTGLWLTTHWLGGLGALLRPTNPIAHMALTKIALLVALVGLAGYAHHRMLPRLEPRGLGAFTVHAWVVATLSVLLLVLGVGIRTGGLW
jgi:putative copper export protein